MCIRVTEVYAGCRCIYYVHGIDACAGYGRHPVVERVVYVGLNCPRHSRRRELLLTEEVNGTVAPNDTVPIDLPQASSHDQQSRPINRNVAATITSTTTASSAPAEMPAVPLGALRHESGPGEKKAS
ncbi:Hypothetical protein D9617_33g038540 [Elsinoe fawcettii]|nr:Hypothetical protein D9617_33g038540 [Elsinoe fawcettii]